MPNFRVIFSKDSSLIYISHLDLNHAFIRALNRANVELKYSEGFNPHPKLVFALPLSVGMAGEREILDVGVADEGITAEKFFSLLLENLPQHITVREVFQVEKKLKDIKSAKYEIIIEKSGISAAVTALLGGDIFIVKKTKSGEKELNIKPQILDYEVIEKDGKTVILSEMCADSAGYLNPELLMRAMCERNILCENDIYTITRKEIIAGSEV